MFIFTILAFTDFDRFAYIVTDIRDKIYPLMHNEYSSRQGYLNRLQAT